jgi:hypothetical protein
MQTKCNAKLLPALLLLLSSWILASCAGLPTQEMSDARQALQAARQARAVNLAPGLLLAAEQELQTAEEALQAGNYPQAREAANHARTLAVRAFEKARENTN